jgi:L-threonylcarbamoyladenylate synthase
MTFGSTISGPRVSDSIRQTAASGLGNSDPEPMSASRAIIWKVDPERPEPEAIARAASSLRAGGVIIYPTETLYGLGGDPMIEAAVRKVYGIKGRDYRKPLPLIAASSSAVKEIVAEWPIEAERLAEAFWPGALTLVLNVSGCKPGVAAPGRRGLLPPLIHGHTGKIAIRVSSNLVAQALSAAAGGLLISTSANVSGQPPYSDADEIPPALLAEVDGVLHAGRLAGGLPSTIVEASSKPPKLIRAGCVSWEDIRKVLGMDISG